MSPADLQATFCATLVDEWIDLGVRHAVIAPGSRSTPMALAIAARPELQVHVVHDERTAAFIALGLGLAAHQPALLLCTSGTAATHFHAAVVEAGLSDVPMIVLTADRPPELHGIGAAQTIDQQELYGTAVRQFIDAGVPETLDEDGWRKLAIEVHGGRGGRDHPGPVHLNLPFREPLIGVATVSARPRPDESGWFTHEPEQPSDDVRAVLAPLDRQRGIIVVGDGAVSDPIEVEMVSAALGWPVLADPRSGVRDLSCAVATYDALLRHPEFARAHTPEVVLHIGEPPASKVLGQWLQASGAHQMLVHPSRRVIDPWQMLSGRVYSWLGDVTSVLGDFRGATGTPWLARWQHAERRAQAAIAGVLDAETALSEPGVANVLSGIDEVAAIVAASSMPIRDLEWFGAPGSAKVVSNRGANGIDGVIATATGFALERRGHVVCLLGDVAFCHDSSSLTALARRDVHLTIVVVDNDGGGIFSFLPQAGALPPERFEQLFGTPHGTDLVALAAAHGIPARTASTRNELIAALRVPGVSVVRVPSNRAENVNVHDRLNAAVAQALG